MLRNHEQTPALLAALTMIGAVAMAIAAACGGSTNESESSSGSTSSSCGAPESVECGGDGLPLALNPSVCGSARVSCFTRIDAGGPVSQFCTSDQSCTGDAFACADNSACAAGERCFAQLVDGGVRASCKPTCAGVDAVVLCNDAAECGDAGACSYFRWAGTHVGSVGRIKACENRAACE